MHVAYGADSILSGGVAVHYVEPISGFVDDVTFSRRDLMARYVLQRHVCAGDASSM